MKPSLAHRAVEVAAVTLALRDLRWRIRRTARRFSIDPEAVRQLERDGERSFSVLDEVFDISAQTTTRQARRG